jgi:hypothetical protein
MVMEIELGFGQPESRPYRCWIDGEFGGCCVGLVERLIAARGGGRLGVS